MDYGVPNERSSGVTLPPLPRHKRLYKVNSVVPSVTRVVKRKYLLWVPHRFVKSAATLAGRIFLNASASGKQPVLRALARTPGLPEYSPFKTSARLSMTTAGAVQILIATFACGKAVT